MSGVADNWKEQSSGDSESSFYVLNKLKKESFRSVVELTFVLLLGKQRPSDCLERVSSLFKDNNVDAVLGRNAVKELMQVTKDAISNVLTSSQIKDHLVKLGLNSENTDCFISKFEQEQSTLTQITCKETLNVNRLVDMEWKFGVTASSSEQSKLGNVFLQLKMEVEKGINETSNIVMELTLPEFYNFLHEMEKARASMQYLS